MAEEAEKLYRAEYAKSGRASCKKCGESIAKDSLRLALMVQVPRGGAAGGGLIRPLRSVPPAAGPARGSAPSARRGAPEPLAVPFAAAGASAACF